MNNKHRIIISGAGPVGLSLALLLARCGVRSVVIEKKSGLDPHSRALGILPRTLEILRALGLIDKFLETGVLVRRPQIWMPGRATPSATIHLAPLAELTATPGLLIMPQDQTERLLLEAANQNDDIDIRFGHQFQNFAQDENGVTATVLDDNGEAYQLRGDFLVGCDGSRSTVREQLGWELKGKTYPSRIMLADITLRDHRDKLPWPRARQLSSSILVGLRYAPNHWRLIHTLTPEQNEETVLTQNYIQSLVTQLFGEGEWEIVWKSVFRIHCRRSPHWIRGRVMLCGDAAHLNSPAGGQGMNSGMHDAHNLAWKLAAALAGGQRQALLRSYETERASAVQSGVERFTDLLTRGVLLATPRQRAVFFLLAGLAFRFAFVRSMVVRRATMLDTAYPHNALLRGSHPLLGQRAPDGELTRGGEKKRLLDFVFPGAALLLFDDARLPGWNAEQIQQQLGGLAVPVQVVRITRGNTEGTWTDTSGKIWKDWKLHEPIAALIRPDGHIGWIGKRPTQNELREGITRALGALVS